MYLRRNSPGRQSNYSVLFFALALLPGCLRSATILQILSLRMTKEEAIKAIGRPDAVRAATSFGEDFNYEVHEYVLSIPDRSYNSYWLHYLNNRLLYWGREGDFSGAPKEIIELRVGNQINLK